MDQVLEELIKKEQYLHEDFENIVNFRNSMFDLQDASLKVIDIMNCHLYVFIWRKVSNLFETYHNSKFHFTKIGNEDTYI